MSLALFSVAPFSVTGCFSPERAENLNCSAMGECPDGMTCGTDGVCHSQTDSVDASSTELDARPTAVDAMIPIDAVPVECTDDDACATPPNLCFSPGTCNLETSTCSFPNVTCPTNETCKSYTCNPNTGTCDAEDANEAAICSAESCGAFNSCIFDNGNSCDQEGTQSQQCSESVCASGDCVAAVTTVSQACTRVTNNDSCQGGTICQGFGGCVFDPANSCDQTGTQSRSCTINACTNGSCAGTPTTQTQNCTRDTNNNVCATTTCGAYSACQFSSTCDQTGTQSRTCTDFACSGGGCAPTARTETQTCTRNTNGVDCGTTCGAFGTCGGFSGSCGEEGTHTRTCTTRTCSTGTCVASSGPDTQSCTVDSLGRECNGFICGGSGGFPTHVQIVCCSANATCGDPCGPCMPI